MILVLQEALIFLNHSPKMSQEILWIKMCFPNRFYMILWISR